MSEAESIVFNQAVNFVLPHAIPTHFDRSDEFKLGDVLVYEKKRRPLMPWRKHRLVYTGVNISDLLTESVQIDTKVEQTFSEGSTTRSFGESAKVDAQVSYAIAHLGVDVAESEHASMSTDFGKIDRHYTNFADLISRQTAERKYQVLLKHPVIKDAMAHNKTLFVINHLYVAEKADVSLIYASDDDDKGASADKKAPPSSSTTAGTTSNSGSTTGDTSAGTGDTSAGTGGSTQPPPPTTIPSAGTSISGDVHLAFKLTRKSGNTTQNSYRVI